MEIWTLWSNNMRILSSSLRVRRIVWLLNWVLNETLREKACWDLHKNDECCFEQILEAAPHKTGPGQRIISYLPNHASKTYKTCYVRQTKSVQVISDVDLCTQTHRHTSTDQRTKTYSYGKPEDLIGYSFRSWFRMLCVFEFKYLTQFVFFLTHKIFRRLLCLRMLQKNYGKEKEKRRRYFLNLNFIFLVSYGYSSARTYLLGPLDKQLHLQTRHWNILVVFSGCKTKVNVFCCGWWVQLEFMI